MPDPTISEEELELESLVKWLVDYPPPVGSYSWKPSTTSGNTPGLNVHLLNWVYNELQRNKVTIKKQRNTIQVQAQEIVRLKKRWKERKKYCD